MFHTQNNIDELINGLRNNTIESLQAKDVLRIIYEIEFEEDIILDYDRGYNTGKQDGREEGIQEAIAALENL